LMHTAEQQIRRYNQLCVHYNLIAQGVYAARALHGPFAPAYEPYLVAALLGFDMGRMMGSGAAARYAPAAGGFAARLHAKLMAVRPLLEPLLPADLLTADLAAHGDQIVSAYEQLAANGPDGIHEQGKAFHVGASKLLHFLHPALFIIIDRNTAEVLRQYGGLPEAAGYTGPGYFDNVTFEWRLYGMTTGMSPKPPYSPVTNQNAGGCQPRPPTA